MRRSRMNISTNTKPTSNAIPNSINELQREINMIRAQRQFAKREFNETVLHPYQKRMEQIERSIQQRLHKQSSDPFYSQIWKERRIMMNIFPQEEQLLVFAHGLEIRRNLIERMIKQNEELFTYMECEINVLKDEKDEFLSSLQQQIEIAATVKEIKEKEEKVFTTKVEIIDEEDDKMHHLIRRKEQTKSFATTEITIINDNNEEIVDDYHHQLYYHCNFDDNDNADDISSLHSSISSSNSSSIVNYHTTKSIESNTTNTTMMNTTINDDEESNIATMIPSPAQQKQTTSDNKGGVLSWFRRRRCHTSSSIRQIDTNDSDNKVNDIWMMNGDDDGFTDIPL